MSGWGSVYVMSLDVHQDRPAQTVDLAQATDARWREPCVEIARAIWMITWSRFAKSSRRRPSRLRAIWDHGLR